MVKDAGDFGAGGPHGPRGLQRVVPLVRIEDAELIPEDRFVVGDDRRPAKHVIDDVERPAKVRVPRESCVLDRQPRR